MHHHFLTLILALAATSNSGQKIATIDNVDLMELNHLYDEHGKHVFDQLIFYSWCDETERFQVVSWRLAKKSSMIPRKDFSRNHYISIWKDGNILRMVISNSYRETWTQYDPELLERQELPKDKRKGLTNPASEYFNLER